MQIEKLMYDYNILDSHNIDDIDLKGIQYDSRSIKEGDLFIAIKGFKVNGHHYINDALKNGASIVLIEDKNYCSHDYPWILVSDSRAALADLSAKYFGYPSRNFTLIGITGTNGKTTTSNLIAKILEEQGEKVGLIGTIHNRIGSEILPVERTTPESRDLQELFAQMVQKDVTYVIMEVSSHALDLMRVRGSEFDIAVFTNLTQDHLDYHETMENYFNAKSKLFFELTNESSKKQKKYAIINKDDEWGKLLLQKYRGNKISYSIEEDTDFKAEEIKISAKGVEYNVNKTKVNLKLTGKFNVYNSLAALAVASSINIPLKKAIKTIEEINGVAGRFQVINNSCGFSVIIDYAHTADSLVNILTTAKEFVQNKIITVFGCGGDRDKSKRPKMGEAAAKYSDYCIVTSDNPRTENPEAIIKDILPGIQKEISNEQYEIIINRKDAIKKAVEVAHEGDIIIIAGKGHETYQEINGKKYPFDDKEIVEELLMLHK
ncbi:UDP-N-acetylmuramoylalanyl-D-glutamate--2,6-diaminopimelate ligase [Desulfonispora thiosulfatigenes DSM 11270]|uniref:UDP-N-acetylmuramoyl-L-alanyl-D-glutamate--2,6-diaminopimelate ligase n=1 Tax=Desulfonispora thiosulfatigenes DSM 11270 TaxID=656914 RepID=A0A1W1VSU1_DESTI|nr:UDP-N-acetylmuramoyl-L-alanyl-D-glutamate--2,6-diaminopimelate ligase [Desulfonispora thiosulfatigenes]SMB96442.1 UDP-N-acetylmuramoylalanyl-D-glutamate--2,6-diaminopimelate ligase [Desulfonispora thiosulfatigenes DSM 11270]